MTNNFKYLFIGIIFLLLLIIIISKNNIKGTKDTNKMRLNKAIKILVRQASRWATAASQDNNSMIAVLHANYGAGYLWALKDIATENQIKEATGIDLFKFEQEIIKIQDIATMKMAKLCPEYAPERTYLTVLGGEGV